MSCTPQNDVHTSEDILTKMIKKFPLTRNLFWLYIFRNTESFTVTSLSFFIVCYVSEPSLGIYNLLITIFYKDCKYIIYMVLYFSVILQDFFLFHNLF